MSARNNVFSAFASLLALTAFAAPIAQDDARTAAEAFVANDAIGSAILGGRTVDGLQKRDQLWIVALQPSGHIILSASDLAAPIVGFSENDFTEPDPESPAYTVLQGTSDKIRRLEESAATERDPQWDALLAPIPSRKLLGAPSTENPETVVIEHFIDSSYNQLQPYNDYAPIYEASINNLDGYRGRCPCGCVATAAAQGIRHFRWPARIDRVDSCNHNFKGSGDFPIRFDGHTSIDWDSLYDSYDYYVETYVTNYYDGGGYSWWIEHNYDLRGTVPEAKRFPIARLILWMDVLAKMKFTSNNSSANYGTVASNISEWYTPGTWVKPTDSRVISDLRKGVPLQVTIPGHAVVCHGWAESGSTKYMYFNYGWGGNNDGYYDTSSIQEAYVGHYPRAKPQLDPLPAVCPTSLKLKWHFPDFYTNNLSGFTVSAQTNFTQKITFRDDFSNSDGIIAQAGNVTYKTLNDLYVGQNSSYGNGKGNMLIAEPLAIKTYTFNKEFKLTATSVLSFDLRSRNQSSDCIFEIQASFDDGAWTTILTPTLSISEGYETDYGWKNQRVNLSQHSGENAKFRIYKGTNSGSYWNNSLILLDNFTITDVLSKETISAASHDVGATQRSCVIENLVNGGDYTFTVTPKFETTSSPLVPAETSDPVGTTINNANWLETPEIRSVSHVEEEFYKECGTNTTYFTVKCSDNVTKLQAHPSHLNLVKDEDVKCYKAGNGDWRVKITPSGVNENNYRSRMILTLEATDSNGTKAYKDLSLRFDSVAEPTSVTKKIMVNDPMTSTSPKEIDIEIPIDWLEENGLADSHDTAEKLNTEVNDDSDGDGFSNWQEFICGTSPTNATEKIECKIKIVNGQPVVTAENTDGVIKELGFKAVIKETDSLGSGAAWTTIPEGESPSKHFFRVVIEPTEE